MRIKCDCGWVQCAAADKILSRKLSSKIIDDWCEASDSILLCIVLSMNLSLPLLETKDARLHLVLLPEMYGLSFFFSNRHCHM